MNRTLLLILTLMTSLAIHADDEPIDAADGSLCADVSLAGDPDVICNQNETDRILEHLKTYNLIHGSDLELEVPIRTKREDGRTCRGFCVKSKFEDSLKAGTNECVPDRMLERLETVDDPYRLQLWNIMCEKAYENRDLLAKQGSAFTLSYMDAKRVQDEFEELHSQNEAILRQLENLNSLKAQAEVSNDPAPDIPRHNHY